MTGVPPEGHDLWRLDGQVLYLLLSEGGDVAHRCDVTGTSQLHKAVGAVEGVEV